jgi:hypothetical protein
MAFLRCELSFKVLVVDLEWGLIVESRVETFAIIEELDVPGNSPAGMLACRQDSPVDELVFQGCVERFGHGVVVADPGPTD